MKYLIQSEFKNGLEMKLSNARFFTLEEIAEYAEFCHTYECRISTNQNDRVLYDFAMHWARKEDIGRIDDMLNCIKISSSSMSFPFLKLCYLRDDGSFSKPLNCALINNKIYIIKSKKNDVYQKISELDDSRMVKS